MTFDEHVIAYLAEAWGRVPRAHHDKVSALTLELIAEEDDVLRQSAVAIGWIESEVADLRSMMRFEDGALGVLADPTEDPEGANALGSWATANGLVDPADRDDDMTLRWDDETSEWVGGFQDALGMLLARAVRHHHQAQTIRTSFGRGVPVAVFYITDPSSSFRWTRAANPAGIIANLPDQLNAPAVQPTPRPVERGVVTPSGDELLIARVPDTDEWTCRRPGQLSSLSAEGRYLEAIIAETLDQPDFTYTDLPDWLRNFADEIRATTPPG